MAAKRIKLVLVDDHEILREGLRLVLSRQPDMEVAGEAGDAQSALECVKTTSPDLVIMDILLPDKNGVAVARELHASFPQLRIIMLSSLSDPSYAHEALEAGVSGYVLKENAGEELLRAIRAAMAGKLFLCPGITTAIFRDPKPAARTGSSKPGLNPREERLLHLVATGLRNKQIAAELNMSVNSVEACRSRLMAKLGCHSTAELVRYAVREDIVNP